MSSLAVVTPSNDPPGIAPSRRPSGTGLRLVVDNNEETDASLFRAAADGDASAFRRLVERYLSRAVATARRLLGNDGNAEDVAQEAFVRLWNRLSNLDVGASGIWPWLRRVIFNLCMDRRRARRETVADALEVIAGPDDPHRDAETADLANRVQEAMNALPDRQQAAIGLFHYEGYTVKEIADMMDATADAVDSLLGRARRALKKSLRDEWQSLLPGVDTLDVSSVGGEDN